MTVPLLSGVDPAYTTGKVRVLAVLTLVVGVALGKDKGPATGTALDKDKAFVPGVIGMAVAVGALGIGAVLGMGAALSMGTALSTGTTLLLASLVVTGKVTMAGVMCALLGTARSRAELSDGWQEQNWQPE
jgi:hypothetical protein